MNPLHQFLAFTFPQRAARLRRGAILAFAAAGVMLLPAGCNTAKKSRMELVSPTEGWTTPSAVDIENFNGSVTIIVDPSVTEPTPVMRAHASLWVPDSVRKRAVESVRMGVKTSEQEGRAVYSIRTVPNWPDRTEVWADVTLRMPRCDGVRIYNRGGIVRLTGVSGALQIDNGEFGGRRGSIEVRTDEAMIDPVALVTDSGDVVYQITTGSTGEFTLDSLDGEETFDAAIVLPRMVRSDGTVTRATVGDEHNAVLLRSNKGDVKVVYMNEPEKYVRRLR